MRKCKFDTNNFSFLLKYIKVLLVKNSVTYSLFNYL